MWPYGCTSAIDQHKTSPILAYTHGQELTRILCALTRHFAAFDRRDLSAFIRRNALSKCDKVRSEIRAKACEPLPRIRRQTVLSRNTRRVVSVDVYSSAMFRSRQKPSGRIMFIFWAIFFFFFRCGFVKINR